MRVGAGCAFEHLTSLCFHLTPVKNFSILKETHRSTLLVSAHHPLSLPPPKAVLPHVVRLSSRSGGWSHSVLSIPQRRQAGGKAHEAGIRLRPRRKRRSRLQEGHWSILACVTVMCESPTDIPHAPQELHCLKAEKILDTHPTPPILTTASSPMHRSSPTGPSLLPRTGATPFGLTSFFCLCCAASSPFSHMLPLGT